MLHETAGGAGAGRSPAMCLVLFLGQFARPHARGCVCRKDAQWDHECCLLTRRSQHAAAIRAALVGVHCAPARTSKQLHFLRRFCKERTSEVTLPTEPIASLLTHCCAASAEGFVGVGETSAVALACDH